MDPNATTPSPERQSLTPEVGGEQLEAEKLEVKAAPAAAEAGQNGPKADDGTAAAQAHVAAVTTDDQVQATTATQVQAPAPQVAADVDVIEPEWVKKAEEAVAQNRDDPHAEEEAVEAVQIDYLKKRYNLDVKPGDKAP